MTDNISVYEKREALKRLLQSRHFAKAKRLSHFLEFVCEESFRGNAEKLNEYLIGVDIYERGTDFDPQQDAIVRVQAHEIRRRLKDYYSEEGKDDPLRLEFPAGHYVPVFSRVRNEAPPPADTASVHERARAPAAPFVRTRNALTVAFALLSFVLGALLVREKYLNSHQAPQSEPSLPQSMDWFWGPFLRPAEPPMIVIPNHPLLRAAHDGDSPTTLDQSQLIPKEKLPAFRDTMHFRELKGFYFVPSVTDFTAVGEAVGLLNFFELFNRMGQSVRVRQSRLVDYEMVKRGNTILLGGNQAWSGRIFLYPEGFWFHVGVITNKNPRAGEQEVYRPEFDPITNSLRKDYALVLMLANEKKNERILLIYGIYTQGSQAAIEFVTSEERLGELRKALGALEPSRKTPPRFFQVLLQTTVENYVPGKATFVSARIIPDDLAAGIAR